MDLFRENGLESVVTLVKGKVEDVTLPVNKVKLRKGCEFPGQ